MATKSTWIKILIFILIPFLICIVFSYIMLDGNILLTAKVMAIFLGAVGLCGLAVGINGFRLKDLSKRCTSSTEAELVSVNTDELNDTEVPVGYMFKYFVDDTEYISETLDTKGVFMDTPLGSKYTIWYDPGKPEDFYVSEEQSLRSDRKLASTVLLVSIIFIALGVIAFMSI